MIQIQKTIQIQNSDGTPSTNANIVQTSKNLLQNKNRFQRFQKPFSVVFAVSKAPWTVKIQAPPSNRATIAPQNSHFYTIEQEVNTNYRCLSPTFVFTDLSHHRTCGSAYGGSYFGCHSRYEPISVGQPAWCSFCDEAARCIIGELLTLQYPLTYPHLLASYLLMPHRTRFFILVFGSFQAFHIHMRIRRLNHSSVSSKRRFILAR